MILKIIESGYKTKPLTTRTDYGLGLQTDYAVSCKWIAG